MATFYVPTGQPDVQLTPVLQNQLYANNVTLFLLTAGGKPKLPYFWEYNYDDAPIWSGAPTSNNTLRLLTEGGQPPTPEWLPRYTQDDPAFWQGKPVPRNYALYNLLAPTPFFNSQFNQFVYDDSAVWSGSPTSDETLRLLTEQTPQKPNFWKYDYDEVGIWIGSPTSDNAIRLLTEGGQPPTPEWLPRYTQDDPPVWQFAFNRNIALLSPNNPVKPSFWQFGLDDPAVWSGSPTSDGTLRLLTEQTPQQPHFWKYDYDEGGIWVGSPTSDNTLRSLTVGGQPPTPEWLPRYTYDDSAFWQGAPVPQNHVLFNLLTLSPFVNPQFNQFSYDDPPVTDRQISLQRFLGQADIRFTPTAKPSFWTSIEDSPFWQGAPTPSWIIPELTQQTPIKPSLWKNDYDDAGSWYQPSHKNLALKTTPTFQAAWAINSNIVVGGVAT